MKTDRFKTHFPACNYKCFCGALRRQLKAFVVFIVLIASIMAPISISTLWAEEMAPDFNLPDLSGKMVSLSEFRGKYVIVDFWATWCVPCRNSLSVLAQADSKYRERNLVILGLTVDNPDSFDNAYLTKFVSKFDIKYPILRADNTVISQYLGDEDPTIPTLFIIDRQGRIVEKHEGVVSDELDLMLERLLTDQ